MSNWFEWLRFWQNWFPSLAANSVPRNYNRSEDNCLIGVIRFLAASISPTMATISCWNLNKSPIRLFTISGSTGQKSSLSHVTSRGIKYNTQWRRCWIWFQYSMMVDIMHWALVFLSFSRRDLQHIHGRISLANIL